MAKAKKRVVTRKKSSKRGKVSAKPGRKKAAKHTTPKKTKSKVRRASRGAPKSMAKKKRRPTTPARKARKTPRQIVQVPVEDTIIDVIEEPVPGVVVVTEYELLRTTTPTSFGREPKRGAVPRRKNNKSIRFVSCFGVEGHFCGVTEGVRAEPLLAVDVN